MTETGYNGWTNYETWVTALWIDNDQGSYAEAREIVAEEVDEEGTGRSIAVDRLRGWVEECMVPNLGGSLAADLLGHALCQINWFEIVDTIRSEV